MRIVLVVAVLASVSACKKDNGECVGAVAKMKKVLAGTAPDEQADAIEKALVGRCTTDKWSSDAIDCVKTAATVEELDHCQDKFTKDQGAEIEKTLDRLLNGGTARTPDQLEKARKQDELDRQYDEKHKNDPKPPKEEPKPEAAPEAKPEGEGDKPKAEGEGDKPKEE